jgi:hypothetical protein
MIPNLKQPIEFVLSYMQFMPLFHCLVMSMNFMFLYVT